MLKQALEAWKYWGVQRHLHFMPLGERRQGDRPDARRPRRGVLPNLVEVMPGGRKKEFET